LVLPDPNTYDSRLRNTPEATVDAVCVAREPCDTTFNTESKTITTQSCVPKATTQIALIFSSDVRTASKANWEEYIATSSTSAVFAQYASEFEAAAEWHLKDFDVTVVDDNGTVQYHAFLNVLFNAAASNRERRGSRPSRNGPSTLQRSRKFDFSAFAGAQPCATLTEAGEVYCESGGCTPTNVCCDVGYSSVAAGTCTDCGTYGTVLGQGTEFYSDAKESRESELACDQQEECGPTFGNYYADFTIKSSRNYLGERCIPMTQCLTEEPRPWGKLLGSASTTTADAVCGDDVQMCTEGQFWTNYGASFEADEWTTQPTCSELQDCTGTKYWSNSDTMTTYKNEGVIYTEDRDCTERTSCATTTHYISNSRLIAELGDNSIVDNKCEELSPACDAATQWESVAETTTSDRQCKSATTCENDQYLVSELEESADRVCNDWTECTDGVEFETVAPNATTNRECQQLQECPVGTHYIKVEHTATSDRVCTTIEPFVVVRPFYDGDAQDLVDSFDRFSVDNNKFAPCALDSNNNPTADGLPVDMILYYSRDATSTEADTATTIAKLDGIVASDNTAAWRNCFGTISILGANLSAAEDQYHADQSDPTWNLGPNMQFYRFVEYMESYSSADTFYYMEGDSVPVAVNWLEALSAEIDAKRPFSVLGSRYSGHNWDKFDSSVINDALAFHLNGNAVYDVSHSVVSSALDAYNGNGNFATVLQPSFDVCFTETLIGEQNVSVADLESAGYEYKESELFANFATTLTLPDNIDSTTVKIVHGAVYLQHWPSPSCPRELNADWYPGYPMSESSPSTEQLTLVVSDFGDGEFFNFFDSLLAAATYAEAQVTSTSCGSNITHKLDALPFKKIIVVAPNQDLVRSYETALDDTSTYPSAPRQNFDIEFIERDSARDVAWWDLCDTPVDTEWFMLMTSHFTVEEKFTLPVDVDSDGNLKPIVPFLKHDSAYCGRACKSQIEDARFISPSFDNHINQEYAVFKTSIQTEYCASEYVSAADPPEVPSIDGYFAFVDKESGTSTSGSSCEGQADSPLCIHMLDACTSDDIVGDYIRQAGVCAVSCNSCSQATNITVDYDREEQPTQDWWERKSTGGVGDTYKSLSTEYNREKLFTAVGTLGREDTSERCEDNADGVHTDCPCKFPFYMYDETTEENIKYDSCTSAIPGTLDQQTSCPTALTNTQEFLLTSDDWRHCVSDDIEGGDRRRSRRGGNWAVAEESSVAYRPRVARHDNETDCDPDRQRRETAAADALVASLRSEVSSLKREHAALLVDLVHSSVTIATEKEMEQHANVDSAPDDSKLVSALRAMLSALSEERDSLQEENRLLSEMCTENDNAGTTYL
jgi:hypothetical protein